MAPAHTLIPLPQRKDDRGTLVFGQDSDNLPFPVRRFFTLSGIAPGAGRGGHAHRQQHQLLIMVAGSARVIVDNGHSRTAVALDRPDLALHVPPMLWLDLENFSSGSVCLVLASDLYDESDYIRGRNEFLRLTTGG